MFITSPAAPADVPAAAAVLASAFQHDTVMASVVGPGATTPRLAALFRALLRVGAMRSGRVDLARRESDGAVLGVAVWEAPGHRTRLLDQLTELPSFVGALGWRGILSAARQQSVLASFRPAEPHWYLAEIGVSSDARGAGVGSALLASRLEVIDAERMPAYLESSNERNRTLYRRNGFTTIAHVRGIPNVSPAAMWRPAQVAA